MLSNNGWEKTKNFQYFTKLIEVYTLVHSLFITVGVTTVSLRLDIGVFGWEIHKAGIQLLQKGLVFMKESLYLLKSKYQIYFL